MSPLRTVWLLAVFCVCAVQTFPDIEVGGERIVGGFLKAKVTGEYQAEAVSVHSIAYVGEPTAPITALRVGAQGVAPENVFNGWLGPILVFDRVLSGDDVANIGVAS